MRPTIRRAMIFCAVVYTTALVLLSIVWSVAPVLPWWLALANIVAALWFLPVPLYLLLACALRSRRLLVSSASAAVCFGFLFGSFWLPSAEKARSGTTLRIATFNHHYANQDVAAVSQRIAAQQADVVVFQELSPTIAAHIASELSTTFPYQWLMPAENASGLGIISRYPFDENAIEDDFRAQQVQLHVAQDTITLINAHPNIPFPSMPGHSLADMIDQARQYDKGKRSAQLRALIGHVRGIATPLIVAGDFNTSEREAVFGGLAAEMIDVYRATATGFGFTFPNASPDLSLPFVFPVARIDYVWVKGDIAPHNAVVDCQYTGSDHCMLTADVVIP